MEMAGQYQDQGQHAPHFKRNTAFNDIFGRPSAPPQQHPSHAQPYPNYSQGNNYSQPALPPLQYQQQHRQSPDLQQGSFHQQHLSPGGAHSSINNIQPQSRYYAPPNEQHLYPYQQQPSYPYNHAGPSSSRNASPAAASSASGGSNSGGQPQYSSSSSNSALPPPVPPQIHRAQSQASHTSSTSSYAPTASSSPSGSVSPPASRSPTVSPVNSLTPLPPPLHHHHQQHQYQREPHHLPQGAGPPRLPEFVASTDEFFGFDSAPNQQPGVGAPGLTQRDSFDSLWSLQAAGGAVNSAAIQNQRYPHGSAASAYPDRRDSPGSIYDSVLSEEVDGFDPAGPRVSNYQYYDQNQVYYPPPTGASSSSSTLDGTRRNSIESDRTSLYRQSTNSSASTRPLLPVNPSSVSLSSTHQSYPYNTGPSSYSNHNSPTMGTMNLPGRRSSESLRVMPTQPRVSGVGQDQRSFSFSSGERQPNMSSRPSSTTLPSIGSSSMISTIPGGSSITPNNSTSRAPVVYPALLSRVAEALKNRISVAERVKDGLVYAETFDGRDAVDKIAYIIKTSDRNLALLLGRALDAQKFFHDVTYDHRLRDSPHELYQFRERLSTFRDADITSPVDELGAPLLGPVAPPTSSSIQQGRPRSSSLADTISSGDESSLPSGVFTLLTDCYSPTCTRDRLCYSIACPRRLEQQNRLHLKPKPGLQRSISSESLGDDFREPGSLWIHSVPQEVADSISESEQKRQEALNEVFYTERDFVRDMEYLRDSWIKPLRTLNIIPEARREDFVTQVFWNVLEIHAVNFRLAEMLNKRQKQAHVVDKIGDILLEMVPLFAPFVRYGAHQLYGKYEFEKEKGANPAFAKFVDETERQPESRKLELNGYLTKPTTRLARYPLLLEACLKNTPDDNPDKQTLPKVVKLVREFLNKVNIETGKSENRFNLAQLDQQLVFKNGDAVDLQLRDEDREMIFKGPLKKRGGAQGESAELTVYLFDHAILMVKQKSKNEQSKVYRKPIPLELLVVAPLEESQATRGGAVRPKSLMSRTAPRYLANAPAGIDKANKQGFAMTFIHLGRQGYQITLWSASWAGRKKWLEKIEGRQQELREKSLVFETIPLSAGYFVGTNRVTCAAPFENGNRMVYGTDNGVYLSNLRDTHKVPVKVISVPNVTQLDVLEEQGILIVLADKAVQTFFVDNLDPGDAIGAAKRARKISSHATFFKAGQCLGRTLVCVVKSGTVSSTIKTLEPVDQVRGKKQPAIRKFLQGSNDALRVFKEFYIPTESSSVHFLKSKLCVGCTKGFEIVDLETLDTQGLLDPADSSLDFVQKRENAKPIAIYRIEGEFLLCYDEFAFYVNKNGWRAKSNWLIQWEGFPTSFALHYPYVLAFEPNFVEVRHVESGALMQIIPGNSLRCLFADTPPSASSSSMNYYSPYGGGRGQAPPLRFLPRPIIISDMDRIFLVSPAPPQVPLSPTPGGNGVLVRQ